MNSLVTSGVSVDGENGIVFDTVNKNLNAVFGSEAQMEGGPYENVNLRKFTLYPYGGFDGWDIYRKSRTTGDEFRANTYKGA